MRELLVAHAKKIGSFEIQIFPGLVVEGYLDNLAKALSEQKNRLKTLLEKGQSSIELVKEVKIRIDLKNLKNEALMIEQV